MVALQPWFKENWIKKITNPDFVVWGLINTKYSTEELEWIYDSHVIAPDTKAEEPKPLAVIEEETNNPEQEIQTITHESGTDEIIAPEQAGTGN